MCQKFWELKRIIYKKLSKLKTLDPPFEVAALLATTPSMSPLRSFHSAMGDLGHGVDTLFKFLWVFGDGV